MHPCPPAEDPKGNELRVAFDFDGVLADDSSERIMQEKALSAFHQHETDHIADPLPEGRLSELLRGINRTQDVEESRVLQDSSYKRRVHVSIVAAPNAPSHERVVRTLQSWGVRVNDAFFLGE